MEIALSNLEIASLIFNFVGTIVIIISLLYVAKQTSLTNKIAQGESEREMFNSFNELLYQYSDYDSIDLIQRAFENYNVLSSKEKARFNIIYIIPHVNNCEQFYQLHKRNLISDERLMTTLNLVIAILKTTGGKQCWIELQKAFNPEFIDFINQKIQQAHTVPPITDFLTWLRPDQIESKTI